MTDVFSKEKRSWVMSRIRGKNTNPELLLFKNIKSLWVEGYRYRFHHKKIEGRPDLVFPKQKLAIFIDGDFWHGKNYSAWGNRLPSEFWKKKILGNMMRDKKINRILKSKGWRVLRVWDEDFEKNPDKLIK